MRILFFTKKIPWLRMIIDIVLIYVVIMLGLYLGANYLMFPAPEPSYEPEEPYFTLPVDGGEHLTALYLENAQAEFTILYSHGNGEDLGHIRPLLEEYREQGFSVFAYDYRGYGCSSGSATEHNTYADIQAAYNYLREEAGVSSGRILAMGRSVGGGPALHIAQKTSLAGVILESTFVSASRVLTRFPVFPLDRFRNLKKIKRIDEPVLVVHGTADRTIPFWHGKKLHEAATSSRKKHLWVEGSGHNDLIHTAGGDYWEKLDAFTATLSVP